MRKQTKLVAVLSASALLAIGASMTSFAASPWVEENGTWVYYEKNGDKATETWRKSGDKWYYLDENGEMAENQLIEYDNNYYYVDQGGAMVIGEWRSVENEDYEGEDDDEPMTWWYYFGPNGKAYKASSTGTSASFKVINGYKYIFDEEGKMLYGWIDENGVRQTGDAAWQDGVYYCGEYNDGRQRNNEWAYLDIIDTGYTDTKKNQSTEFTFDDENQTRWFWFLANGKKVKGKDGYTVPLDKKKYSFDEYGRMNAAWATNNKTNTTAPNTASQSQAAYTGMFHYYGDPEDGARVTRGFFKAVPDWYLDTKDYDDSQERTYYADRNGNLVAGKIETISGKKYAFNTYGEMQTGLKAIDNSANNFKVIGNDVNGMEYDTEENFKNHINGLMDGTLDSDGHSYKMYYFGSDGAMLTGKQTVSIDGESFTFFFNKSGASKGAGYTGLKDKKYYLGGMLLTADKSDKYAVVIIDSNGDYTTKIGDEFISVAGVKEDSSLIDKKNEDKYSTAYAVTAPANTKYILINTAGSVQQNKKKAKDSNGYCFDTNKDGEITAIYVES